MLDWLYVAFYAALLTAVVTLGAVSLRARQATLATEERQIMDAAVDDAVAQTITAVSTQIAGGTTTDGPFTSIGTVTTPACAGAAVSGALCTGTVTITETMTGFSGESPAQVAGFAYQQTLVNQNLALTDSGNHVEGRAMFALAIALKTSSGITLSTRDGTLTLRTLAGPLPSSNPPQYAVLSGYTDTSGNLNGTQAESDVAGVCDPTNPAAVCTSTAADTTAVANGDAAGADDSRIHAQRTCYDAGVGVGLDTTNRCTPTGDPPATPMPVDAFANTTIGTGNVAGSGWSP